LDRSDYVPRCSGDRYGGVGYLDNGRRSYPESTNAAASGAGPLDEVQAAIHASRIPSLANLLRGGQGNYHSTDANENTSEQAR
jgi:hypothetical protein